MTTVEQPRWKKEEEEEEISEMRDGVVLNNMDGERRLCWDGMIRRLMGNDGALGENKKKYEYFF